ncbi:MAG TPA: hypothetical protein PK910_09475 [Bacteroidales bacterium]|nr:hypothetical protein [Bacteroidales bacterium]HRC90231.1 hypothetical protein [Bacteroidales bacterium]
MRNYIVLLVLFAINLEVNAQKVSAYSYKLDNGITVKTERTWSRVWVQQTQEAFNPSEQPQSVVVNMRVMGELTKGHTFKLTSAGKDIKLKDAAPGIYNLKITSSLSGKPGNIVIDISGIEVKPKMKTVVTVTIYDYQINIDETTATTSGLASCEFVVNRYKGNPEQNFNRGVPSFYAKGNKDNKLTPDETTASNKIKIKPGTYDVLLTIEIPGYNQKVWLENFTLKANTNYKVSVNMNAGEIIYGGVLRDVSKLHLYPSGTYDKLNGVAKPEKSMEFLVCEPAISKFPCSPGTFDVLLNIGNGKRYEWRKAQVVRTGMVTTVK